MNKCPFFGEEIAHFRMIEEFPALVWVHTLICAGWIALTEEVQWTLQRRTLGDASVSMFHSCEVIGHKCPARFAIDSFTFLLLVGVAGRHTRETEVNREALMRFVLPRKLDVVQREPSSLLPGCVWDIG